MKRSLFCVLFLMTITTLSQSQTATKIEAEFCDFKLPKAIAQAHATFPVVFKVSVGGDGKPMTVAKIRNNFLEDAPFVECMNRWTLPKNSELSVFFQWTHGEGWTQMSISGKDIDYTVKFQQGAFSQHRAQ